MSRITDGRDAGAFITAALDDFGLDPYAFRIYARIVRRAGTMQGCFESIDNMANACLISRDRVYKALKLLIKHRLIEKEPRTGRPSSYFLTPPSEWIPLTNLSRFRDTHLSRIRDTTYPEIGTPLSRNRDTTYPEIGTPLSRNRDTPITDSGYPPITDSGHKGIKERDQRKEQQEGGKKTVADDVPIDPFYNGFQKAIAKEIQQRQINGPKNFIIDAPWGELAQELGKDPLAVFQQFEEFLIAKNSDKKDPDAYAKKIANNLFQSPGSEHVCKPWIEFADFFRKNLFAPPAPKKTEPRQPQIVEIPDREASRKALQEAKRAINPPA